MTMTQYTSLFDMLAAAAPEAIALRAPERAPLSHAGLQQQVRDTVQALICRPVALNDAPAGPELRVRARHYLVAGGAINSPALLLRSNAPDPHQRRLAVDLHARQIDNQLALVRALGGSPAAASAPVPRQQFPKFSRGRATPAARRGRRYPSAT